MALRTLSLFAGCDGLGLAVDLAARYLGLGEPRPLCYVEREITACTILAARFADRSLPAAPIWSDVSTFNGRRVRGLVDIIHGGFPCQNLSVAGKREGIHGAKSGLWFEYVRIIREVQPRWVFVENVSGVLMGDAGRAVLGELAGLGFDAEWLTLRASDVGAPHQRKRVFILARNMANSSRGESGQGRIAEPGEATRGRAYVGLAGPSGILGHAPSPRHGSGQPVASGPLRDEARRAQPDGRRDDVDDAERSEWGPFLERARDFSTWERRERDKAAGRVRESGEVLADATGPRLEEWRGIGGDGGQEFATAERGGVAMADARRERGELLEREIRDEPAGEGRDLADANSQGRWEVAGSAFSNEAANGPARRIECEPNRNHQPRRDCPDLPIFPPGPGDIDAWSRILTERPDLAPAVESGVRRLADGIPGELEFDQSERAGRLRSMGNAVCPPCGAVAFVELFRRFGKE